MAFERTNSEVDAAPDRAGIVQVLKASAVNVEVTSTHLPIRIVVPRRGIGGGPEEGADVVLVEVLNPTYPPSTVSRLLA